MLWIGLVLISTCVSFGAALLFGRFVALNTGQDEHEAEWLWTQRSPTMYRNCGKMPEAAE